MNHHTPTTRPEAVPPRHAPLPARLERLSDLTHAAWTRAIDTGQTVARRRATYRRWQAVLATVERLA